jgi:hypothetical protein
LFGKGVSGPRNHFFNDLDGIIVTGAKVWALPDFSLAPARYGRFSAMMCRHRPHFPV